MSPSFCPQRSGQRDYLSDSTPYSAVSSFNLPVIYDSSLVTPVSMVQPLTIDTKRGYISPQEMDIKLSPSELSPEYNLFNTDEDLISNRHNKPMSHKYSTNRLRISTSENSFPPSPCIPSTPYFGSYAVSVPPLSASSHSSPGMNQSPIIHNLSVASGMSSDNRHPRLPTPVNGHFRVPGEPVRIAPTPPTLLPALQPDGRPYRQNSLSSLHSLSTALSNTSTPMDKPYPERLARLQLRRKRKSPRDSHDGEILLSGDMTHEEQVLMYYSETEKLPWKEVAVKFKEKTGKDMRVPALQMRKKRLIERLRVWTPTDERALLLASQSHDKNRWDQIATTMLKYGCVERWSKETLQKKWYELHPEGDYSSEYETGSRRSLPGDYGGDAYSDGRNSISHSDNGTFVSAHSNVDDARSPASSHASSHYSIEQQIHQHLRFGIEEEQNWS
ncbi:hypothetical protein B0O99DRAFT_593550 [Bisporella sp. PMI_857]|nr:hypothetical protein B0O99DRAFT_593550 [Bisporella sp. PMI_857]